MSQSRVDRLRAIRAELGHDAVLVTDPLNRHYLTGHRGGDHGLAESGGIVLISEVDAIFLADRNNLDWVKSETDPGFDVTAWERPWPRAAPVIMTTFPSIRPMVLTPPCSGSRRRRRA